MKHIYLSLLILLSTTFIGQIYQFENFTNGSPVTTTSCKAGISVGNQTGYYGNNYNKQVTFYSGSASVPIRINFLPITDGTYNYLYYTEPGYDFIYIYDNATGTGAPIATLSGVQYWTIQSLAYTSLTGYLTVKFTSDGSNVGYGFNAIIGCQPQNCNNNAPADDECSTAPTICDLNGYCGNTSGWYTVDHGYNGPDISSLAATPKFCGSIENNSWVAFTAGSTSATFSVTSSGCLVAGSGIQAEVFETATCGTAASYVSHSSCVSQSTSAGSFNLTATSLIVGQKYYIMVDGFAGNICDYQIQAISGVQTPSVSASATSLCAGNTSTLTASAAGTGITYLWTDGVSTISTSSVVAVTPAVTTNYTCTITGACGATSSQSLHIVVNPIPVVTSISSQTVCSGSPVSAINFTTTVGTVNWSNNNTAVGIVASGTGNIGGYTAPIVATQQVGALTVTATQSGCTSTPKNFSVTIIPKPTVSIAPTPATTVCLNNSISLTSSGASTYTWASSANGGLASTSGSPVGATPIGSGTSSYTVTATSAAGCTNTAVQNINVIALPVISITPANSGTLCSGSTISLTGSGASTYSWQSPAGGGLTGSGSVVNISPTTSPVTYTVIGTAANSCSNSAVNTVTVVTTPTISVSNPSSTQSSTLCTGNSVVLTASGAGSFTWTPSATLSSSTGNAVTATPTNTASPTIYTVTGTSAAGCISPASSQGTFTVTVNPIPSVSITSAPSSTICLNNSISLTASGSNTFGWTSSANGGLASTSGSPVNATPSSSGTASYTVTATSAAGCTNTAVQNITVNALPSVTITPASSGTLCSGTSITLTGSGAASYTWQSPAGGGLTGSGSVVSIAPTTSPLTYTVIGTAANTCTNSAVKTITVIATPTISVSNPSSTQSSTLCSGNSVVLTATGAGSFTWTPSATLSSSTGNAVTATPTNTASPTVYTVTGTSSAGCISPASSQGTFTVTVNSTPTITAISSRSACAGSTVLSLSFSVVPSSATVNWTNNNTSTGLASSGTGSTISAFTASNVTIATTGIITATASINGCTSTFSHTLTINPLPIVTASPSQTITCAAPTVTLTGSSNPSSAAPVWSGGVSTGVNSYTATASSANIYTLTATTLAGCANSATTQVVPSAGVPTVSTTATNSLNCNVTTAQVIATTSTSPVSYSWTGPGIVSGATTSTASVNAGGQYTVVVTNTSSMCSSTITLAVPSNTTPITPTISATGSITCATPTLALNGSPTSGVTYTWTGTGVVSGVHSQTAAINAGGTYVLNITDNATGCVGSQSIAVSTNTTAPTVSLTPTSSYTTTCANPTVALNTSVNPSTNITYSWTAPSTGALNSYTVSNPVASGSGIFTVSITNTVNGCGGTSTASQATVNITADAGAPVTTISQTTASITCSTPIQSATITTSPSSNITYTWSPAPATGLNSAVATFTAPGTYICSVTNTLNACPGSTQIVIGTNTATPVAAVTPTVSLNCNPAIATINSTVTPSSGITYSWSGGAISGSNTGSSVSVTSAGTYTLIALNAVNGCSATATSTVTNNTTPPTLSVTPAGTVISCATPTLNLNAATNSTVIPVWNTPTGNAYNPIIAGAPGVYTVTITDPLSGCTNSLTIAITGSTVVPVINIMPDASIACGASSATLSATSSVSMGVTYSWTGPGSGSITSGSNTAAPVVSQVGVYTVTATNSNGCVSTSTVNVTQGNITASFTADPTTGISPLTVNYTNTSTGATAYDWNFGNGSPNSSTTNAGNVFIGNGSYTVTLTASSGTCVSTATAVIIVEDGLTLEIPNVFTPNNDGTNDIFTIKSTGVKDISLQIFNRWGEKLYEFSGVKASWDGMTPHGAKVPDATYFYFVKATGFDNTQIEKHGTVNLFR